MKAFLEVMKAGRWTLVAAFTTLASGKTALDRLTAAGVEARIVVRLFD